MYRTEIKLVAEKKFTDITQVLQTIVEKSGIRNGVVNIHTTHTTCGLKIMENEILSLSDIDDFLERLAPMNGKYAHDKIDLRQVPLTERINGVSHIRMLFFNSSIGIPIADGKPILGEWQSVIFVEMDGLPPRERRVIFSITNY